MLSRVCRSDWVIEKHQVRDNIRTVFGYFTQEIIFILVVDIVNALDSENHILILSANPVHWIDLITEREVINKQSLNSTIGVPDVSRRPCLNSNLQTGMLKLTWFSVFGFG